MTTNHSNNPSTSPSAKPRRRGWRRFELKVLLVVALLIGARLAWLWLARGSSVPTISEQTTFVTAPLRADGTVDYIAAYNEHNSQGVTRENNAAFLLLPLFGAGDNESEPVAMEHGSWTKMLAALGTVALPKSEGVQVRSILEEERTSAARAGTSIDTNEMYEQACKAPWLAKDLPVVKKIIDANNAALERVVTASRRPRYYVPRFSADREYQYDRSWGGTFGRYGGGRYEPIDDPSMRLLMLPDMACLRDVNGLLAARGMMRLGEEKNREAADDFLACHRLARLLAQDPLLSCQLTSRAMDNIASTNDVVLAHYGKLKPDELADYRRRLSELPPWPERSSIGERFALLDSLTALAAGRTTLRALTGDDQRNRGYAHVGAYVPFAQTDELLRTGNEACDEWQRVLQLPTIGARQRETAILIDQWKERNEAAGSVGHIAARVTIGTPRQMGRDLGTAVVALWLPGMAIIDWESNQAKYQAIAELAFQLAEYRARHGSYPDDLAALGSAILSAEHKGLFGPDGPHYERTKEGYIVSDFPIVKSGSPSRPSNIFLEMPIPKKQESTSASPTGVLFPTVATPAATGP